MYGGQFDIYTDNNPLTYILTTAKLDAICQRWVASLANYDFRIFYKSGKTNVEADALSRIPQDNHTILDTPTVKTIMNVTPYTDWSDYNFHPTDLVCKSTQIVVHKKSKDDWKVEQENDPIIGPVIEAIKSKTSDTTGFSNENKVVQKQKSLIISLRSIVQKNIQWSATGESVSICFTQNLLETIFRGLS